MKNVEDSTLAVRAQDGDREAFGILVERYADQARRVAWAALGNPDDADDAAQDAFLSVLKKIDRYDPKRPFGPWLMRIVANAATDRRRRERVRATDQLPLDAKTQSLGPDAETDRLGFSKALREALADLPERQRIAVTLFDVEGYSHAEIAEMIDIPQGTVRSDVFHARRRLREALAPWKRDMQEERV
ncbi:MAG: sigma-70 family RNA polymerase sigma factor [Gemmatimonadota bacterium]|nr:sigma-70 family RNA polymerase sigma factor [Gemmatimonadota bacterium]